MPPAIAGATARGRSFAADAHKAMDIDARSPACPAGNAPSPLLKMGSRSGVSFPVFMPIAKNRDALCNWGVSPRNPGGIEIIEHKLNRSPGIANSVVFLNPLHPRKRTAASHHEDRPQKHRRMLWRNLVGDGTSTASHLATRCNRKAHRCCGKRPACIRDLRPAYFTLAAVGNMVDPVFDQSQKDLNRAPLDDPRILSGPFWAQLRVFLAVAKAKSYNKAGDELGMSRQTIAREIRRLQDLLGAVLLVPSRNGIQLTDRGRDLATKLLSLDQMFFSLYHEMRADTREAEGQVRIVGTEAMTGFFIVPGLVGFNARYPKIRAWLRNPSTC
jgi:hypothetical protein